MPRAAWFFTFSLGSLAAIMSAFFLLFTTTNPSHPDLPLPLVQGYASENINSYSFHEVSVQARSADARAILISNYLKKYASPLMPYAELIVKISDKYSLDYRLLVAIAQQESNLCHRIPPGSHNCWGYGIYGDKVTRFDSYPAALETVASGLRNNYLNQGLDTPEKIMVKYTPPSVSLGGPWARGVNFFLEALE